MLNTAPNVAERRDLDSVLQYLSDSNHFLYGRLELHEFSENIAISVYFLTKQMLRKQAQANLALSLYHLLVLN